MNLELWKKRKKELGLTHDALALKSGVSRRTIAGIFSGNEKYASPTLNTTQAIEDALGLSKPLEWTDEDKASGVGQHPTYLSERETNWLELGSEVQRVLGEDYYKMLVNMLEAVINQKK